MGSFLEEIANGNLGDILGSILGGGDSSSGGGLEDVIESMRKKMGGEASPVDNEEPASSGGGLEDIMKEIKKRMGVGGDDDVVATDNDSSSGNWDEDDVNSDIVKELRKKRGLDPDGPSSSTSDIAKEMRKKSGLDPEGKPKSSKDVFEDLEDDQDEPVDESQDAEDSGFGGIGDIFKKLGIDPSNLGGLAESVLKTIGLAGNAI